MFIRRIDKSDRDMYIALVNEFYSSDAVLHKIPPENIVATFNELVRSDAYTIGYFIEVDDEVIGYALTARHFSQEAGGEVIWIDEIYIRDTCRGRGYGNQLLEYVFSAFPKAAAFRLEIEPDNTGARRLYERAGFTSLGYAQMIREHNM